MTGKNIDTFKKLIADLRNNLSLEKTAAEAESLQKLRKLMQDDKDLSSQLNGLAPMNGAWILYAIKGFRSMGPRSLLAAPGIEPDYGDMPIGEIHFFESMSDLATIFRGLPDAQSAARSLLGNNYWQMARAGLKECPELHRMCLKYIGTEMLESVGRENEETLKDENIELKLAASMIRLYNIDEDPYSLGTYLEFGTAGFDTYILQYWKEYSDAEVHKPFSATVFENRHTDLLAHDPGERFKLVDLLGDIAAI